MLEIDQFADRVGESFEVAVSETEGHRLELTEVTSLGERDPGERQVRSHPFSLLFAGPREPLLDQGIRRLRHPELGEIDLFLVPIDQTSRSALYEAVFT